MAANTPIDFKDPSYITIWLNAALKKEKEKYEKCPVIPDMVQDYVAAQGWGYVVVGYFLVEQAFKALLHVRGKPVSRIHSLSDLFALIGQEDKGGSPRILYRLQNDHWREYRSISIRIP